jgi:hypothetical protein
VVEQRLMHFGFAQPLIGMLAISFAIVFLIEPWWLVVICFAAVTAAFVLSEWWVLRRVDRRIAAWGKSHGFHQVVRQPRGGFVTWGWTLLTTAEMYHYSALDVNGRELRITASYQSDALGLRLRTLAEADSENGGMSSV